MFQNRFPDQSGEWPYQSPISAELPPCCPAEALDPGFGRKNRGLGLSFWRRRPQLEIPRNLGVACAGEINKVRCLEVHAAAAIRTPKTSCNTNHQFVIRKFVQDDEACALNALAQIARNAHHIIAVARHSFSGSESHQQARQPQLPEVRM